MQEAAEQACIDFCDVARYMIPYPLGDSILYHLVLHET